MKAWNLIKDNPQEAEEYRRQRREQRNNLPPQEKARLNKEREERRQKWLASLTPIELQAYRKKVTEKWRKHESKYTPEKKQAIYKKAKENYKKKYHDPTTGEKEKRALLEQKRRQNFTEEQRQKDRDKSNIRNFQNKLKIIEHYSNGTMRCMSPDCEVPGGSRNLLSLCVDHVNGGGRKHMEKLGFKGGTNFYNWLIKNNYPKDVQLQILCMNCNIIKKVKNQEDNHVAKKEKEGKAQN